MKRPLRWAIRSLLAGGLGVLAYCGFVLTDAWLFQLEQRQEFQTQLSKTTPTARKNAIFVDLHPPPSISPVGLIGKLEIPRLELSVIVLEGTDAGTLRHAVGHIPGTSLPGMPGNTGLSGHRDTFFRPLQDIRHHDLIQLTTKLGIYRYRVRSIQVVNPGEITVLNSTGTETLTLVTCHPFTFLGAAPRRFIVQAERIQS
ncbi:MAG: class D sortase [Bryobacteraceae bacterium]|nr:class D sortase [Bryobacteraceae bacterium]